MFKPRVYITRQIFPDALDLIEKSADLELWPEDEPPSPEQLREAMADVDGAQEWTSPAGTALSAKFLAPVPVTIDNLNAVLDAGWISKEALCQGVTDVAACN